jgi:hypothetical protein
MAEQSNEQEQHVLVTNDNKSIADSIDNDNDNEMVEQSNEQEQHVIVTNNIESVADSIDNDNDRREEREKTGTSPTGS